MNLYKVLLVIFLSLLMIAGCSKKKEDAEKLQDEVLQQEGAVATDSATMTPVTVDSAATDIGDASAVPPPEEIKETPKEMPRRPQGDGFTVQIAGCDDESYAKHLIEVYTERGYEPYMITTSVGDRTVYRVRIGAYASYKEAAALKNELEDKYSINTWIDRVQ